MIDTQKLREVVASNIERLCQHFFPNGRKESGEWKIADTSGAEGNSLGISLSADKAGVWRDRATDESGNFVQLLERNRNLLFLEAVDEISRYLGVDLETQNRSTRNGSEPHSFDWASCVKLSKEHAKLLANWRGLSEQFVGWLIETDLVRVYTQNESDRWVFPVHLNGAVAGTHSRPVIWTRKDKRCQWTIYPLNDQGGPGMRPLVIGNLKEAATVHLSESTWDMLALCDKLGLHKTDGFAAICTRGAANAKLASIVPNTVREVFLWEQNDHAGKTWSDAVVRVLPTTTKAKAVYTPNQYEDPNDWTLKGNATAQQLVEAISAAVAFQAPKEEEKTDGDKRLPVLSGASLLEYSRRTINPELTLLGKRWLCVGGGAIIVGPSGIGKSTLSIQAAALWACGRAAFGIKPNRPLRVLIVQAEDDEGDSIEMARMVYQLGLDNESLDLIGRNTHLEFLNDQTGLGFTKRLAAILEQKQSDLVIINPLSAYLGADTKDEEKVNQFLRNWINPILTTNRTAAIFIHHTPKTTTRGDTSKWRASDWMYAGSGVAGITNWARAYLVVEPTDTNGVFKFIAAKRGQRIEWASELGNPVFEGYFRHSRLPEVILWEAVDEKDVPKANSKFKTVDLDQLLALVPVLDPELKDNFHQRAAGIFQVGTNKIKDTMRQLHVDGKVFSHSIPNPGKGRSYTGWAKTPGFEQQNEKSDER